MVGQTSLQSRRNNHLMIFICKTLLLKPPNYLISLLPLKSHNCSTPSSNCFTSDTPNVSRATFTYCAPFRGSELHTSLTLQSYIPLKDVKTLLPDLFMILVTVLHLFYCLIVCLWRLVTWTCPQGLETWPESSTDRLDTWIGLASNCLRLGLKTALSISDAFIFVVQAVMWYYLGTTWASLEVC